MARETKVGVLTGLAFIICFAIVLANRGTPHTVPTLEYLTDRTVNEARREAAGSSHLVPTQAQLASGNPAYTTNPYAQRLDRPAVSITPGLSPGNGQVAGGSNAVDPARLAPGRTNPDTVGAQNSTLTQSLDPQLAQIQQGQATNPTLLQRIQEMAQPGTKPVDGAGAGGVTPNSTSVAQVEGKKHVVAPGETLSKIASAHYGKKSSSIVNAIFEANRSVLSSPDALKAGMELVLPEIGGKTKANPIQVAAAADNSLTDGVTLDARTKVAVQDSGQDVGKDGKSKKGRDVKAGRESADKKVQAASASAGGQWYQVRKNDRLVSIARDQLGDAGRWEEIYNLNRDKFPDPGKIREGVRIKLPAKAETSRGKGA